MISSTVWRPVYRVEAYHNPIVIKPSDRCRERERSFSVAASVRVRALSYKTESTLAFVFVFESYPYIRDASKFLVEFWIREFYAGRDQPSRRVGNVMKQQLERKWEDNYYVIEACQVNFLDTIILTDRRYKKSKAS